MFVFEILGKLLSFITKTGKRLTKKQQIIERLKRLRIAMMHSRLQNQMYNMTPYNDIKMNRKENQSFRRNTNLTKNIEKRRQDIQLTNRDKYCGFNKALARAYC
jgi:hypothetical protein